MKIIKKYRNFTLLLLVTCGISLLLWHLIAHFKPHKQTIKIGIIHSLTGDLAISEKPVVDATMLAIKEINQAGGVLGKQIEPIIADGKSDEAIFGTEAERLITQKKVVALFGCWSSPSRIAVKNVVEKYNSLLFYPLQFEGLENSPNIVYTSTTPNQQIIPGVVWCLKHLGKSFFLVGSDLLLHEIIKDVIYAYNGTIVGEEYLALKNKNVLPIVEKIVATKPDVILNNIEGESNLLFFDELRKHGITPEKIPSMSFSIAEPELQLFGSNSMTGDYATWSYFQSINSPENKEFVKKIQSAYGKDHVTSDPMEAGYFGVYFWKQAVEKAQSTETDRIRPALTNQSFNAPEGIVYVNKSQQTWELVRVGKIRSDKQFTVIWSSQKAICPMTYPPFRSVATWKDLRVKMKQKEENND
jgi:urea transport system substrate-binding protein